MDLYFTFKIKHGEEKKNKKENFYLRFPLSKLKWLKCIFNVEVIEKSV